MTANLRKEEDVASLETFLRQRVFGGRGVKLVSAGSGDKPRHQFGNTQSGVRRNGDSRTIHIINTETVTQVPLVPAGCLQHLACVFSFPALLALRVRYDKKY